MGAQTSNFYISSTNQIDSSIQLGGSGGLFIDVHTPTATIQGTWTTSIDPAMETNAVFYNVTSHADADEINYIATFTAGTYNLDVLHWKVGSMGIFKIYVGATLYKTIDGYAAVEDQNVYNRTTGLNITETGVQTVRVVIDGKNGAASDHKCAIQKLVFTRTA